VIKKQLLFHLYIIIAFHCENGGKMYLERLDKNVFMIAENKMNNDVGINVLLNYYLTTDIIFLILIPLIYIPIKI